MAAMNQYSTAFQNFCLLEKGVNGLQRFPTPCPRWQRACGASRRRWCGHARQQSLPRRAPGWCNLRLADPSCGALRHRPAFSCLLGVTAPRHRWLRAPCVFLGQ